MLSDTCAIRTESWRDINILQARKKALSLCREGKTRVLLWEIVLERVSITAASLTFQREDVKEDEEEVGVT